MVVQNSLSLYYKGFFKTSRRGVRIFTHTIYFSSAKFGGLSMCGWLRVQHKNKHLLGTM